MIKVLQTIQQYLVTNSFPITTIIPITYNTCNMDSACARTWPSTSRHSRSNRFGRIPRISAGQLAARSRCRIETPFPPLPCAFSSSTMACLFWYSFTLSCLRNTNHVTVKMNWRWRWLSLHFSQYSTRVRLVIYSLITKLLIIKNEKTQKRKRKTKNGTETKTGRGKNQIWMRTWNGCSTRSTQI